MPPAPDESISVCPGCGGKNPGASTECDWCGRPFLSKGGRLRLTLWQVLSSLMLLGLIGAVAALAILSNAGRALPPVRVGVGTTTPQPTAVPTLTPRVTAANLSTPTPAPVAAAAPTPVPTPAAPPTPEPTPTPQMQPARIFNTSGLGAWVHEQPGQQARRTRVLSEGTRVLLTGNDQTVAARPWREIETEDHNLKGWVQGDFLQLQQGAP
ncbi:MAG TPA: hypothetical protein VK898_17810 [Chloroflexota bacterium]|nr:hypothetical protein [Chloroflexota bacterium]